MLAQRQHSSNAVTDAINKKTSHIVAAAAAHAISSQFVSAAFDARGLTALNVSGAPGVTVQTDTWAVAVDSFAINSSTLADPAVSQPDAETLTFTYTAQPAAGGTVYTVAVTYEAHTDWRFLRKTLSIASSAPAEALHIGSIAPFDALLLTAASALTGAVYPTGDLGTYGVFGRFADGSGLVAAATNPFQLPSAAPAGVAGGVLVHVGFHPAATWNFSTAAAPAPAPYVADAGLLGLYTLSPHAVPPAIEAEAASRRFRLTRPYARRLEAPRGALAGAVSHATDTRAGMLVEHVAFGSVRGGGSGADPSWLNYAERDAYRALGEAHFQSPPAQAPRIHIPWTENDYQIDMGNASQAAAYTRILTQLARIGVDRVLYAASNSAVSSYANCTDDWCWEPALWLNMGEDVRAGVWVPGADALPPTVQALVDTAAGLGVSAVPYSYPTLGFTRPAAQGGAGNSPWLYPRGGGGGGGGKFYSSFASREFQDYFAALTVNFSRQTGALGAGYDYTFFDDPASSVYAQWAGWRRVLATVRAAMTGPGLPDYVVDNRQMSHTWSPWMWAAGSYAEPLQSDEQTTSWTAYVPDLHIDRTDGNRQRQMNYDYAQSKLCQPSAMPGFFHHNSDRGCSGDRAVQCNVRDYDFYGAPYTLLSAVATGGANAVVCDIPARDEGEFAAFPLAAPAPTTISVDFYRTWLDFARTHRALLLRTQFLPVPPAAGAIDGTYAIDGGAGGGFVFLFNPNSRALATPPALLTFDAATLGLPCAAGADVFAVSEVWPEPAPNFTTVACGGNLSVAVEGRNALVLAIAPFAPFAPAPAAEGEGEAEVQLMGRAARTASTARLVRLDDGASGSGGGTLALAVGGTLLDAVLPAGVTQPCAWSLVAAPLYALVPAGAAARLTRVRMEGPRDASSSPSTSAGTELKHRWVDAADAVAADSSLKEEEDEEEGCWPAPRSFRPVPVAPAGFRLLAISLPAAAAASFVHNQPVAGMGYDPTFAGGALSGTVRVPQAVLDQLAARAGAYPVPWTPADLAVPWLAPGRLLLYVDAGRLIPSGTAIPAMLGGAPLAVAPAWTCRSVKAESCFMGYWVDLTGLVAADTDYNLTLTLPALPPPVQPGPRVGWDMRNGDLPGMPVTLNASDYSLCWGLCNATAACVAWAYGDAGAGCEPAPHCWLKASVEPWSQDACRVAGLQPAAGGGGFQGVYYDNVDTVYQPVRAAVAGR